MANGFKTDLTFGSRKCTLPAELILGLGMHVGQEEIASIAGDPVYLGRQALDVIDIAQDKRRQNHVEIVLRKRSYFAGALEKLYAWDSLLPGNFDHCRGSIDSSQAARILIGK